MKKYLLHSIIIVLFLNVSFLYSFPNFTVFCSLLMPSGDFGGTDFDQGLAKTGYGLGVEMSIPTKTSGLNLISSINYFSNGVKTDEIERAMLYYILDADLAANAQVSMDYNSWKNIPIMVGLKYEIPLFDLIKAYGSGLFGLNISCAGTRIIESSGSGTVEGTYLDVDYQFDSTTETKYGSACSFGFGFGFGFVLMDRLNIGFRYFNLGTPTFSGEYQYSFNWYDELTGDDNSTEKGKDELKQSISIIQIQLGVNL